MNTRIIAIIVVMLSTLPVIAAEKAVTVQSAYLNEVMELADGLGMKVDPRQSLLPQVV